MLKRLKKLYVDNRDIKVIKNEIKDLRNQVTELRKLYKENDKEYNRVINKHISERHKTIFGLYGKIDSIRGEMFN